MSKVDKAIKGLENLRKEIATDYIRETDQAARTIDDALELLYKQKPKLVKVYDDKWVSDNRRLITCPICEEWLDYEDWMFCPKCGQAVKWE